MKQFNTFTANSPSRSGYNPTNPASPNFVFPSQTESRGQDQKNNICYKDHTFKKIPSAEILKQEPEEEKDLIEYESHSQISLLLSQVSVPGTQRPQYNVNRLFALENNITQNILQLREHKITLMQELSKMMDSRNLYEQYLLKKTKELDDRQTAYDSRVNQLEKSPQSAVSPQDEILPTHISASILRRNEELHLKLKELQIKEEIFGPSFNEGEGEQSNSKKMLEQIMHVRELNNKLKSQIATKLKNISEKDSRLVTFLPQDKLKHQQPSPLEELQTLKERYASLVMTAKESVFKLSEQQMDYVESLRSQNQELLLQAQQMLRQKQASNLPQLRQKLQQNEKEKSFFFSQFQKFKSAMKLVKDENNRLKRQLNF